MAQSVKDLTEQLVKVRDPQKALEIAIQIKELVKTRKKEQQKTP